MVRYGISQASRRITMKITQDDKLRKRIRKIENKLKLSRMKTCPPLSSSNPAFSPGSLQILGKYSAALHRKAIRLPSIPICIADQPAHLPVKRCQTFTFLVVIAIFWHQAEYLQFLQTNARLRFFPVLPGNIHNFAKSMKKRQAHF